MPDRPTVVYRYDGTLEGLLCCLFASYEHREMPHAVLLADGPETLWPCREIATDTARARRVWQAIPSRISATARDFTREGFLTCLPEKELHLLRFLRMGFHYGPRVMNMQACDTLTALRQAIRHLYFEYSHLQGFLRFSVHSGGMTATIAPKNYQLPLLGPHFAARFSSERFLIFDETHRAAFFYEPYRYEILPMDAFTPPAAGEEERFYQALWQRFYHIAAVEGRYNPRLRMTHMAKRYWAHLVEHPEESRPPAGADLPAAEGSKLPPTL